MDTPISGPQRLSGTWALLKSSPLLLPLPLALISFSPSPRVSFPPLPPELPTGRTVLCCWLVQCPSPPGGESSSGSVLGSSQVPGTDPGQGLCGHNWILSCPTGLPRHPAWGLQLLLGLKSLSLPFEYIQWFRLLRALWPLVTVGVRRMSAGGGTSRIKYQGLAPNHKLTLPSGPS